MKSGDLVRGARPAGASPAYPRTLTLVPRVGGRRLSRILLAPEPDDCLCGSRFAVRGGKMYTSQCCRRPWGSAWGISR